jgi:hypothetical protein
MLKQKPERRNEYSDVKTKTLDVATYREGWELVAASWGGKRQTAQIAVDEGEYSRKAFKVTHKREGKNQHTIRFHVEDQELEDWDNIQLSGDADIEKKVKLGGYEVLKSQSKTVDSVSEAVDLIDEYVGKAESAAEEARA